jgi:hypothetical protein
MLPAASLVSKNGHVELNGLTTAEVDVDFYAFSMIVAHGMELDHEACRLQNKIVDSTKGFDERIQIFFQSNPVCIRMSEIPPFSPYMVT